MMDGSGFLRRVFDLAGVLLALAGGGLVTTIVGIAGDASPVELAGVGVLSALVLVAGVHVYREAHPDDRLRESRREKVTRWREMIDRPRFPQVQDEGDDWVYFDDTGECAELLALMTRRERKTWEKTLDRPMLYQTIARLERKWQLV